jgi:hypothetical protein
MTRTDKKILFTALAFFAVLAKGKDAGSAEAADQIHQLAVLVEGFCARSESGMPATTDAGGQSLDTIIERHLSELRENEETHLPEDRVALINLHDRLSQRKSRRMCREFYASAAVSQIADKVLRLLDEEIDDLSRAKLA